MDSIATATSQDASKKPVLTSSEKSGEKETLKNMLEALQKQQEQINTFMKNTQDDLKAMES